MGSFKFNKNTNAENWIKQIDYSNLHHIKYVCDFLEHINEWRDINWSDINYYFKVNYFRNKEFYYENYITLLNCLIDFGEPAVKSFGKYLTESWFFSVIWDNYYGLFLDTNNYPFFFEIYFQDYIKKCSSSGMILSEFLDRTKRDSLTFLQMSPDSKRFILEKLQSKDIYERTTAAYFLTSSKNIDVLDVSIKIIKEIDINDYTAFIYTYSIMIISNIVSTHREQISKVQIQAIKEAIFKCIDNYFLCRFLHNDIFDYFLEPEFEKFAEIFEWKTDQLFEKAKIHAYTKNWEKLRSLWEDVRNDFYVFYFAQTDRNSKFLIMCVISEVSKELTDNTIADFFIKLIKQTEDYDILTEAIGHYEYIKKDTNYSSVKEFDLERYKEKRKKLFDNKMINNSIADFFLNIIKQTEDYDILTKAISYYEDIIKKDPNYSKVREFNLERYKEKRKKLYENKMETKGKAEIEAKRVENDVSESRDYKTLQDLSADSWGRVGEVQTELVRFFEYYESQFGEKILANITENDLFEEITIIFVEIYDILLSIHRSDYFNFLYFLMNKDKIPTTKESLEILKKELPSLLEGYKKTIDELMEENF